MCLGIGKLFWLEKFGERKAEQLHNYVGLCGHQLLTVAAVGSHIEFYCLLASTIRNGNTTGRTGI